MLASVVLRSDEPDARLCGVTNKNLLNKDFYLNTFMHIQQDDTGQKIWKCAAPSNARSSSGCFAVAAYPQMLVAFVTSYPPRLNAPATLWMKM
jgi:hypothetical protein